MADNQQRAEYDPGQVRVSQWLAYGGGAALLGSTALLPGRDLYDWRFSLWINLIQSLLIVLATCAASVGAVGLIAHKLTERSLKIIDLIWMCFAAIGLAFSLTQNFANIGDKIRSANDQQLDSFRLMIPMLTDVAETQLCGLQTGSDVKLCEALRGAWVMAISVVRVPTDEQTNIICTPRTRANAQATQTLAKLCSIILKVQQYKSTSERFDNSNAMLREVLPLWQMLLCFALGIRLTKSVIEVGWLRLGPRANAVSSARVPGAPRAKLARRRA